MSDVELSAFFLEYDGKLFECVYLDDHPDFSYSPPASPIFLLLPHRFSP